MEKIKTCFKCLVPQPLTEFYKHRFMADGHLNKCKGCTKKDMALRFVGKRDLIREYEKKRQQTEARREKKRGYCKRARERDPVRAKARWDLNNAVRDGRIFRGPCEVCGTTERVEAHHEDYSRPLDVRWLCFKHHREVGHGQHAVRG